MKIAAAPVRRMERIGLIMPLISEKNMTGMERCTGGLPILHPESQSQPDRERLVWGSITKLRALKKGLEEGPSEWQWKTGIAVKRRMA
jgi:hypothetical protein